MKSLFSREGLARLGSIDPVYALFAFDFDGTLAQIVADPAKAGMSKRTATLLRRLSGVVKVAVISGRSASDLCARLGFEPAFLVGNHGIEAPGSNIPALELARKECRGWLHALGATAWDSGIELEDKNFSVTLHYRRARNRAAAKKALLQAVGKLSPQPRLIEGKLVLNLLPVGAPDKGSALLDLLRRSNLQQALFIGDDDTDEDVFRLAEKNPHLLTVRVGRKKSSSARFFISRQSQIDELLSLLLARLDGEI